MPFIDETLQVVPLPDTERKKSRLGAEVILPSGMGHVSPEELSHADQETLRQGLFDNGVLVIRNQHGLHPGVMAKLGKLFDPTACDVHSGGDKATTDKKNILSQNRSTRIPRAPQVNAIGKGKFLGHENIPELDLKHVTHTDFHEEPLSADEIKDGFTRPYRWHMDAPFYDRLPGIATTLHAVKIPALPDQKLKFSNDEVMPIAAGATAFYSGARAFELLTREEKEFALNTTVQYAPRSYEWILDCKATDDGITIAKTGREKSLEELPEWTWDKVHAFPMVMRNPGNGDPHLQIGGCNVHSLRTRDPETGNTTLMENLDAVRQKIRALVRKVYAPDNIYAHRWKEGDLVIFHNRGVLHSITGELSGPSDGGADPERRLLWQCTMASSTPPEGFQAVV